MKNVGNIQGSVAASGKGLAGVTVYLDTDNNSILDPGELSTVTDADGNYSFANVPVGPAYIIRQVVPAGYAQSYPTTPADAPATDPVYGIHIALAAGATLTGQNFINTLILPALSAPTPPATTAPTPAPPLAAAPTGTIFTPQTPAGWTPLPSYPNTIYVSQSAGNDANPGTQDQPIQTLAQANKMLQPSTTVLLKRGDTWNEGIGYIGFSNVAYTSYGEAGNRPILIIPATADGVCHVAATAANFILTDIHTWPIGRLPEQPGFSATAPNQFGAQINCNNALIEGCWFDGFFQNVVVDAAAIDGFTMRRCASTRAWQTQGGHAEGIYTDNVTNLVIDQCIFDHNGWLQDASGNVLTTIDMFQHNLYLADDVLGPATVTNCIIANAGSVGCEQRPGGVNRGNLYVNNGLGGQHMFIGGVSGTVAGNAFFDAQDAYPGQRGGGIQMESCISTVTGNLLYGESPLPPTSLSEAFAIQLSGIRSSVPASSYPATTTSTVTGNTVINWGGTGYYAITPRDQNTFANNNLLGTACDQVNLNGDLATWTIAGNHYTQYPGTENAQPYRLGNNPTPWASYVQQTGETGTQTAPPASVSLPMTIEQYAQSVGLAGSSQALIDAAKNMNRWTWDDRYMPVQILPALAG